MSCKSALSNSIKSNSDPSQWIPKQSSVESNVKLAGEEAKDRLYEPKHKKKLVRVLTVVAYIFSVSLAAIMLSLYYIFIWNPNSKAKMLIDSGNVKPKCDCEDKINEALAQFQARQKPDEDSPNINLNTESPTIQNWPTTTEDSSEAIYDDVSSAETKPDSNDIPAQLRKLPTNYDTPDNFLSNETQYK